mmetsp:Transcript_49884/g.160681  ORF Transcript_49884/g.160681 Transcript_49884/m.160681 type:complete len:329 (+) Transcript_49884:504-1490(+)
MRAASNRVAARGTGRRTTPRAATPPSLRRRLEELLARRIRRGGAETTRSLRQRSRGFTARNAWPPAAPSIYTCGRSRHTDRSRGGGRGWRSGCCHSSRASTRRGSGRGCRRRSAGTARSASAGRCWGGARSGRMGRAPLRDGTVRGKLRGTGESTPYPAPPPSRRASRRGWSRRGSRRTWASSMAWIEGWAGSSPRSTRSNAPTTQSRSLRAITVRRRSSRGRWGTRASRGATRPAHLKAASGCRMCCAGRTGAYHPAGSTGRRSSPTWTGCRPCCASQRLRRRGAAGAGTEWTCCRTGSDAPVRCRTGSLSSGRVGERWSCASARGS